MVAGLIAATARISYLYNSRIKSLSAVHPAAR